MKKSILAAGIAAVSLVLVQCKKSEQKTIDMPAEFAKITKAYFDDKNKLNPLDATYNGQEGYNDQLAFEMTDTHRKAQRIFYDKYQSQLKNIDTTALSAEEKISYGIINWETKTGLLMLKSPNNLIPINQFSSTHLIIGQFASGESAQPFKTVKDYRDFLARMDKFSAWVDSAMVYMKKGIEQKATLPKALTVKITPQFEAWISDKPQDNFFYTVIKKMPADFPEKDKKELADGYAKTIAEKLVPKFREMIAFLKGDYLKASRSTSGYGALSFGKEAYETYVKQWTTTDMTPDEIHELGLKEVARLRAEMQKVMDQVGYKGDIKSFCDYVRDKPELKPFKKPEEVIANFKKIHATIKPNVDKLFSLQPKTPFEIRRTEAFREASASAEYVQGSADGTRPGIFYVPIPDVKKYNCYADEDLFLHEAIPGHHFQISLQQENKELPDFRKFNWLGAEGEGWALYTESLGKELGLYTDPYQYFGMLSGEMLRATRLVVDTGLHWKGWTREQVIEYKMANEAEPADGIVMETERYMAIPGQALSYKIGQLKILELRHKAETEMGAKFDIREFHKQILESGLMPLNLLEAKIDRWIKGSKN
ncbi:DUF885 domain-containing protein [Flavobacterium silvaticum]|uniref:DUF885 domain-containing protein n=1 Tax=Flavobacterium silvaticum TaxID=1852020 RepID=A0A972FPQ2_9FLAO|nr:DUF885 domain-containing protein [Flavobacterium silvaticum]NMH27139.1 DUF885 domain-containing protein [Flavobacterium silvaticum]